MHTSHGTVSPWITWIKYFNSIKLFSLSPPPGKAQKQRTERNHAPVFADVGAAYWAMSSCWPQHSATAQLYEAPTYEVLWTNANKRVNNVYGDAFAALLDEISGSFVIVRHLSLQLFLCTHDAPVCLVNVCKILSVLSCWQCCRKLLPKASLYTD